MLEDNISRLVPNGKEHAKEFFTFSDGKKLDHRTLIECLLSNHSETLEWPDISLQLRQRAKELEIAVCGEDTDLAILVKIDIAVGNTDTKKFMEPLKRKGEAMRRWDTMSPAERNAEIEAKRIARDREILTARRELFHISQNALQHGRQKESDILAKPREHRRVPRPSTPKQSGGGGSGGDDEGSDSSDPDLPGPGLRAHHPSSIASSKRNKLRYFNRRLPRRSWRVSERRLAV